MSIPVWNVRGLNDKSRRKDVKFRIARYYRSIGAFVETKVAIQNITRLSNCIFQEWQSCNNFDTSDIRRIWVAWDPRVLLSWMFNKQSHIG